MAKDCAKVTPEGIVSEPMKEFLSVCEGECDHAYCWSQKRNAKKAEPHGKPTLDWHGLAPTFEFEVEKPYPWESEEAHPRCGTNFRQPGEKYCERICILEPHDRNTPHADADGPKRKVSEEAQLPPLDEEYWKWRKQYPGAYDNAVADMKLDCHERQLLAALLVGKGQDEPPTLEEVERVMSWASCIGCGGSLQMLCPRCQIGKAGGESADSIIVARDLLTAFVTMADAGDAPQRMVTDMARDWLETNKTKLNLAPYVAPKLNMKEGE